MNKQIIINAPKIRNNAIIWPIVINGKQECIETTVPDNVKSYLTVDRIDAVVTGLIPFAVRNGYDFRSSLPITDELLYNLRYHLLPAISSNAYMPIIDAPTIKACERQGNIVATGISCGVDSLYTVATHTQLPNDSGNITHLAFFDAGSHHSDKGPSKTKDGRRALARQFALENGFEYFEVSTTLPEFIDRNVLNGYSHLENHSFMMLHCVLTIASGITTYYYSSGHGYNEFNCSYEPTENFDASYYDLLTLMAASYGSIKFYSAGGEKSRLEKIRYIADYKPAHNFLNVCITSVVNCNKCCKCVRTMLELDALGILPRFAKVFDIEYYKDHREWYLNQAYIEALKGESFMKELLPYFKENITVLFKLKAISKKAISIIRNRL